MAGVQLHDVTKCYGQVTVIPPLDLSFAEGEFAVVVGPSGCGKSTTLRMIAGLEAVSSGTIHIAGQDVTQAQPKARDIAMVFQSYALYPHMDVAGNMSFALRLAGVSRAETAQRVGAAAEMLELTDYLTRKPADLSGGQRQRVAMGRAIVRNAYCFLFDEPLSNLDARLRASMRTELALLHKKLGRTMIYVTHDQIEAMTMADRIVVMEKGRVQQVGTPRAVYNAPKNLFVAGFIGSPAMNFLNAQVQGERLVGAGFDLPVPVRLRAALTARKTNKVIVGLRPEHFVRPADVTDARAGDRSGTLAPLHLCVQVAEYIGSCQFLAAQIGAEKVTATIEVGPDCPPLTSGDYLFETSRLYLFDPQSGEAIAPDSSGADGNC